MLVNVRETLICGIQPMLTTASLGPRLGMGYCMASLGPRLGTGHCMASLGPRLGTGYCMASLGPRLGTGHRMASLGPRLGTGHCMASLGPRLGTGHCMASLGPRHCKSRSRHEKSRSGLGKCRSRHEKSRSGLGKCRAFSFFLFNILRCLKHISDHGCWAAKCCFFYPYLADAVPPTTALCEWLKQ